MPSDTLDLRGSSHAQEARNPYPTSYSSFIEAGLMEKAIRHSNRRRYFSGAVLVLIGLALGVCLSVIATPARAAILAALMPAQGREDHGPDVYARLYLRGRWSASSSKSRPLTDAQFERFRRIVRSCGAGRPSPLPSRMRR